MMQRWKIIHQMVFGSGGSGGGGGKSEQNQGRTTKVHPRRQTAVVATSFCAGLMWCYGVGRAETKLQNNNTSQGWSF